MPRQHLQLGDGLVGLFADRLDVEPEEQVAHGGIANDDHLVNSPRSHLEAPAHIPYLKVDTGQDGLLQLTPERPAVVGYAVHDVAAAKALRVFERARVQNVAAFQVDQIQRDRRGAEVHRQPADLAPVVVEAFVTEIHAVAPANGQWHQRHLAADAMRQNLRLAP